VAYASTRAASPFVATYVFQLAGSLTTWRDEVRETKHARPAKQTAAMQPTARETIKAITIPLLLIAVGALFLADYSGGPSARQTWPVILILLGLSLAVQSIVGHGDGHDKGHDNKLAPARAMAPQPKRRSLFMPIFLIAAGAFFLAHNFWPDIPLRAWFANYWPWILIFWGGIRLLEVALAGLLGWSSPRRLGGGAVFTALLLVLVGSIVRAKHEGRGFDLVTIPRLEFLQETYEFPIETSGDVVAEGTLVLKSLRGRVHVTGTDQDGLIICGKKKIRASDRQTAAELDGRLRLDVSRSEQETTIGIDLTADDSTADDSMADEVRRISFDLEVDAPSSVALLADGPLEDISVNNISGSVSVSSGPRIIRLAKIGGPVLVRTSRGRKVEAGDLGATFELHGKVATVELHRVAGAVDIRGDLFGTIRLGELESEARIRSKNGDLRLAGLPGEVEVKVRSVSGSRIQGPVRVESDHWRRVTLEYVSGDVEIQGKRMDVELSASEAFGDIEVILGRGDIDLRLPDDAKFTLDAVSDRGSVRQQSAGDSGEMLHAEKDGPRSSIQGSTGAGPRIRLHTKRGDIVVRGGAGGGEEPRGKVTRIWTVRPSSAIRPGRCERCGPLYRP
jgi:hypothetical protein